MQDFTKEQLKNLKIVGAIVDYILSTLGFLGMVTFIHGLYNGVIDIIPILLTCWCAYKLGPIRRKNEEVRKEYETRK